MHKNIILTVFTLLILSSCANKNKVPVIKGNQDNSPTKSTMTEITPQGYYRVQKGDNLYRIGLKYNQTVTTLVKLNNLADSNSIEVGQLIKVGPSTSVTNSKSSHKQTTGQTSKATTSVTLKNIDFTWPVKGNITKKFNGNNIKGIDIAGQYLSPIKASANGTVTYIDNIEGYGNLILISHNVENSIITAYGYNKDVLVKVGQKVKKGSVISTMGRNNENESRLHFQIRLNSKAVNPEPYLR